MTCKISASTMEDLKPLKLHVGFYRINEGPGSFVFGTAAGYFIVIQSVDEYLALKTRKKSLLSKV